MVTQPSYAVLASWLAGCPPASPHTVFIIFKRNLHTVRLNINRRAPTRCGLVTACRTASGIYNGNFLQLLTSLLTFSLTTAQQPLVDQDLLIIEDYS